MRKLLPLTLAVVAVACAAPPLFLRPAYPLGASRTYRLTVDATTIIDLPSGRRTERAELVARSVVEVLSADEDRTTLRLTVRTVSFRRGGEERPVPEQQAELVVGPDGAVRSIRTIGGLPPDVTGTDAEDLAPILGAPLPRERLHVGSRWRRTITPPVEQPPEGSAAPPAPPSLPSGEQTGRIQALRRVGGYDCAIVTLGTKRPLVRELQVGGQPVQLTGIEFSNAELSFAFRRGFPVRVATDAEGRFTVASGTFTGGAVTVRTKTTLELERATS